MTTLQAVALSALLLVFAASARALKPEDVSAFFVEPGRPSTLRWKAEGGASGRALEYTIRDYWDRPVATGRTTAPEGGVVQAEVQLQQGYYDIEFPPTKERFGVVSLPAQGGRPDGFFCIDGAMSWLVRGDDVREGLIRALRRSGIAMSRERLHWGQVHPAADKWDWQAGGRYEAIRRSYAACGVPVLEMFHDATAWGGLVGRYPDDLVAMARSWQEISRRWRTTWGALEVWNEPDIFFGGDLPADQYVPLVKVLAYGLAGEGLSVPLVGGVLAHCNEQFLDNAAANGMLDHVAAASFHTYGRAAQMEALVGQYRAWLRTSGRASMPLWITECGRPWKKGPPRPPVDQDAQSALDITMKAVEARACGIARYFAFVYPFYEEGENNFGMMGRQGTPLRSMAAYARLASLLADKHYVGDLLCGDAEPDRARVFADAKETVAVLYHPQPRPAARVKLPVPILRAEGIDGRKLDAGKDGAVPLADGLAYAWLDRAKLGDRLRADTPAMRLTRAAQQTPSLRPPPSPVVLRYQFDRTNVTPSAAGYRVKASRPGRLALTVRVFNLAAQAQQLSLKLAFAPDAAKVLAAKTRTVQAPAEGAADVTWQTDLLQAFVDSDRIRAVVTAAGEGAGRIAPLAIDLYGEATLAHRLRRYAQQVPLPISEASRWTPNIAGHGRMALGRSDEGHWRLTVEFGKGDSWVYPFFRLPDDVSLERYRALVLRARCYKPAAVRVFLWEGDAGVGYLTGEPIIPADGEWHTAAVRFADLSPSQANAPDANHRLDLDKVRRISIGLNSKARQNTLEVSDVYVVGGGK
jgi:hypothetical protein